VNLTIKLITPIAMEGLRFAIREGGGTGGAVPSARSSSNQEICLTKNSIRLKLTDYRVLDQSTSEMVEIAKRTGSRVSGPIPLPTVKTSFACSVAHVDKKSREQFEIRTHQRSCILRT